MSVHRTRWSTTRSSAGELRSRRSSGCPVWPRTPSARSASRTKQHFSLCVVVLDKRFGWGSPIYSRVDRSEWSCGSDAFALKATAKKDGDGYLLNGTKGTTKPTCWQPISPALISLVPLPSRQLGSPTPRRLVCSSSWPLWIPRPVHHHLTGFVFITVALIECGTHHCASIRLP